MGLTMLELFTMEKYEEIVVTGEVVQGCRQRGGGGGGGGLIK